MYFPYYRTQDSCQENTEFTFELRIPFKQNSNIKIWQIPNAPFDPFIFAAENTFRGDWAQTFPGRALEIHLNDYPPTDKGTFSLTQLGQYHDQSDSSQHIYYRTGNKLPWGIIVPTEWRYPKEFVDVLEAYPYLEHFVNSGEVKGWYLPHNQIIQNLYGQQ